MEEQALSLGLVVWAWGQLDREEVQRVLFPEGHIARVAEAGKVQEGPCLHHHYLSLQNSTLILRSCVEAHVVVVGEDVVVYMGLLVEVLVVVDMPSVLEGPVDVVVGKGLELLLVVVLALVVSVKWFIINVNGCIIHNN